MSNNSIWKTESNASNQLVSTAFLFLVGIALSFGFRQYATFNFSGESAGFYLGCLLIIASLSGILLGGKEIITIDSQKKIITLESINRLGTNVKKIPFVEISNVSLGEHGDTEGGSIRYYLNVKLKTGKEVNLFFGFFEDSHNKYAMESNCKRLNDLISNK